MDINGVDWPLIHCDVCHSLRPVVADVMPPDERKDHAAIDLLCGVCYSIVATLHQRPTPKDQADAD